IRLPLAREPPFQSQHFQRVSRELGREEVSVPGGASRRVPRGLGRATAREWPNEVTGSGRRLMVPSLRRIISCLRPKVTQDLPPCLLQVS
uniref:Uncharacterized protein n=1 Tax=Ficedula albicollis TaxID=59894 RepID=A0A803WC30_FICAL